jgi:large subunit ribosomal protein L27
VIPGNIIFRQRGTHWFPGDNCAMGRDHTIYATECGYVKYYKDPEKHPKRQYIGVTFERAQVLPLPRNSPRRRRLGMVATKMELPPVEETTIRADLVLEDDGSNGVSVKQTKKNERKGEEGRNLQLRPGYMYREANWEIGRAAERAKVKVRQFKPRDRWTAWRKATIRNAKIAEKKGLGRKIR